jgi:hypothetical protein
VGAGTCFPICLSNSLWSKNISKRGPLNRGSLGFARDDKGGGTSKKSGCWAEGAFHEKRLLAAVGLSATAAVPFVIPSEAEGSAV